MTTKDRVASRPVDAKITGTWASLPARRVAYAVKEGPLHVDGAPGPAGEGARGVSFSADGKHIAYYLKRGSEGHFVRNDEARAAFAGFGMLPPVWSDDARAAFTARKVDGAGKSEWWIVVDGEARFGPFTDDQPGFGSGKSKLAWSARGIAYVAVNGDSMRVEVDGQPLDAFSFALARDPTFSPVPGANRCAYRARRDDKWWMVDGEKVLGPFESCEKPLFSPDGRLFFVATDGVTSRMYVDGVVVDEHAKIHDLAAGAAGHALIVADGDKRRVVHAGLAAPAQVKRSAAYANVLGLGITPDGTHTCAVADRGGQEHVLVDGAVVASGPPGAIPHGALALSVDGAHVAFFMKGKASSSCVRVDGEDGVSSEAFDNLWSDVAFAPDGKSVAFMAEQGDEMFVFTLDAPAARLAITPYAASSEPASAAETAHDSAATASDDVTANDATSPDMSSAATTAVEAAPLGKKKKAAPKKPAAETRGDDEAAPVKKKAASASKKKQDEEAPAKKTAKAKAKK